MVEGGNENVLKSIFVIGGQTVKNEVNIPVLKKLVDDLYSVTVDMTTKRKHTLVGVSPQLLL